MPEAAYSRQRASSFSPTNGRPCSQSGGIGSLSVPSAFAQAMIWSAWSMIEPAASTNGSTNTSSITTSMTATASPRLPHSQRCARSISGQVATTIIAAQMRAARNGRRIQNAAVISPPMNSTASVVCVRSLWRRSMSIASGAPYRNAANATKGATMRLPLRAGPVPWHPPPEEIDSDD